MLKVKRLNVMYKLGDRVVCSFGSRKGLELVIELVLDNSYSCKCDEGKYYSYNDATLTTNTNTK